MQIVAGFYEHVCRCWAAVFNLEQQQPSTIYDITHIATETEIKDVAPFDLEMLLSCHYKIETAIA